MSQWKTLTWKENEGSYNYKFTDATHLLVLWLQYKLRVDSDQFKII